MIDKDSRLPEVIRRWPATRGVFDRWGLHGCGGKFGPQESVEFFARVHKVDLPVLMQELEGATRSESANAYAEELGDILYRRHFRGAIAFLLGAGALLGLLMLLAPVLRLPLLPFGLGWAVQAHANAQIYGWIGLFVMGFACQGLPRFKYVRLWRPGLANLAFQLMVAGVLLHLAVVLPFPVGAWLGLAGGILEAAAAALFAIVLAMTFRSSTTRDPWDKYVWTAVATFVVTAAIDPVLLWGVFFAHEPWSAGAIGRLRDVQLIGFATLMALGVAHRILPAAFGFREVSRLGSSAAFLLIVGGLLAMFLHPAAAIAVAAGAIGLAIEFRAFTSGAPGRSRKFILAAFGWLAAATLLLAIEPFAAPGSVAFHAAARHALAVGFLTTLIVGVSSKVVPVLRGHDLLSLPSLWPVFLLLTAGNLVRVTGDLVADTGSTLAVPARGTGAAMVYVALALWGVHLWRLLGRAPAAAAAPDVRPDLIDGAMTPASVLHWYPALIEIFAANGFAPLRNPLLRATLGRGITIRGACQMKNIDLERLLQDLNDAIREPRRFEV